MIYGGRSMYLDGLDGLDQQIVGLLIENARISYSDIGERIGIKSCGKGPDTGSGAEGHYRGIHNRYQSPEDQRSGILLF